MEQESRELVIRSVDCCNGFVEISRNDTLADLRTKIASDFDDDMIPEQPYCFVVQGIRYSSKQETRKRAWDLQDVAIQPCHKKARITSCTTSMNGIAAVPSSTPLRGEGAQIFVSHEKGVDNSSNNKSAALESSSPMPLTVLEKNLLNNAEDETENETLSDKPVAEKAAEPDEKTVGAEAQEQEDDKSLEDEDLYNAPEEMDHSTLDNSTSENESTEDVVSEIDESLETALVTPKQDPEDVSDTPKVDTTGAVDTLLEEEEEEDNEEPIEVDDRKTAPTENEPENPHVAHDTAIGQSKQVLQDLDQVLKENPLFCSEERRADWTDEIRENLNRSDPNTVIGVLGNTGVGKSSLLNALLDEASVLPTSGSRGCTAAVVELRFNKELQTMNDTDTIWAYKGEVEFIRLEEWTSELNLLVTECSTAEKSIYARRPESDNMPDAAAAW